MNIEETSRMSMEETFCICDPAYGTCPEGTVCETRFWEMAAQCA